MWLDDKEILIEGRFIRIARSAIEMYESLDNPEPFIEVLRKAKQNVDIFTFLQQLPKTEPKYNYYMEWESIAAIPITSFDYWWTKQIDPKMRNKIRKAERKGVFAATSDLNDDFVRGIKSIYDESPIRQGKPFWHYDKDLITIKKLHATYLEKSEFIGAYYEDKLIGFFKMVYADNFASLMNAISQVKHRDKVPTNILLAKAVEICDKKKIPYLIYGKWSEGTLGAFKRHNGCEKIDLPRYFIPLTLRGKIALRLKLHRNVKEMIPKKIKERLIELRSVWHSYKYKGTKDI